MKNKREYGLEENSCPNRTPMTIYEPILIRGCEFYKTREGSEMYINPLDL